MQEISSVFMVKTRITITSILLTAVIMLSYISIFNGCAAALVPSLAEASSSIANNFSIKEYQVPPGSHPHDVAPTIANQDNKNNNTIVWFTAQATGQLGKLDKTTGQTRLIPLGQGSAPHGVI